MSTDPVFSEIQKINPSAIIELFKLQLVTSLHGTNQGQPNVNETNVYRFHAGSNLNANGQIISNKNSDGLSDSLVLKSNSIGYDNFNDYKEYTFTSDNLPSFKSYRIKLILTSTNQCHAPRVRNLRVLALA